MSIKDRAGVSGIGETRYLRGSPSCAVELQFEASLLAAVDVGIYSYTVAHYAYHPSFAGDLPYTLVTVDLAGGPRALGRWLGDAAPAFGAAVQRVILHRESSPKLAFTAV
jgi:uncharacterized OB-fold protein